MLIDNYDLKQLTEPLLDWFSDNARTLPWRENRDPYRIWVSEIMLQQTRVEAVKPYFIRFTAILPDVKSLAECEEEKLLKLWEGLGYYNRVRNMQKAAQQVMEQYNGMMPDSYAELLKLKGIGSYTAGAIASIAYGECVPAVDGNVLRVVSRIAGDERDIMSQAVRKNMELQLTAIIPQGRSGAFNQALMELGAVVCVPNGQPDCLHCPLAGICTAYQEESIGRIPVKTAARKRKVEERTVLLIRDGERILLQKRPASGLLAGMYEFPNIYGIRKESEILDHVREMHLNPLRIEPLEDAKHIFSHVEWHMKGWLIRVEALTPEEEADFVLAETSDFARNYPLPSAYAKYAEYLNIRHGKSGFENWEKDL